MNFSIGSSRTLSHAPRKVSRPFNMPPQRRRDEHQREHHAERLRPVRQRGVEQVMRPGPDVDEDQRPEMNDGKPVGEHRAVRRLGQEVIHQAEVGRGEEERDGVVAVPPLHQRVLHAGIDRVALERSSAGISSELTMCSTATVTRRGDVKPDGHVHVLLAPLEDGAEQIDGEHHPDHRDGDVNRPFQFRVFLARRAARAAA